MTPQVQTIYTHLQQHGSISQAEAGLVYKIRSLPRRISDLKLAIEPKGFTVISTLKKDPTGQRYARYTLVKIEPVVSTEPIPNAPVVALNVKPKVGDRVVVVNPSFWAGIYEKGSIGTVTEVVPDSGDLGDDLYVLFEGSKGTSYLWGIEVEVIANA